MNITQQLQQNKINFHVIRIFYLDWENWASEVRFVENT
jgi:hypothetical protein